MAWDWWLTTSRRSPLSSPDCVAGRRSSPAMTAISFYFCLGLAGSFGFCLGQHSNHRFRLRECAHCLDLLLPLLASADCQSGLRSVRRCSATTAQTYRRLVAIVPRLMAQKTDTISKINRAAAVRNISRGRSWKARPVFQWVTRRKAVTSCSWTRRMNPSPSHPRTV